MSEGLARCPSQPAAGTCFCGRRGALLTGRDNVLPLPLLFIFLKKTGVKRNWSQFLPWRGELIRKLNLFVHRNAGRQKKSERKKYSTKTKIKPTPLLHFPSKFKHFLLCNERLFMLREMNPDLQR